MKILYIHQYFTEPSQPGGTRSYWIAKELVDRGHEVIMITSDPRPKGLRRIEKIDGIEVHYLPSPYSNYLSKVAKVRSFIKFLRMSIAEGMKQKDIDVMFATSTPLTVGGIALFLNKLKKWPYVFEVRDLWPEFPIQIGVIKNKYLISVLRKFEKKIYADSKHVIGLSPGMVDGIIKTGISAKKTSMIPNMSKPEEFGPHEKNLDIAKKFGLNLNHFNVVHFGSMGVANGLQYIIETAKILDGKDVDFIFLGSGATQPVLERMVADYNLSNVKFLGNHPMKTVVEIVNCCDLSVVPFKNIPILATNSPNKLFDSLSAGLPIAVNSAGWTKEMVEENDCGFYVDPDNPSDFADKLLNIKNNKELLARWSKNGRRLSETTYNRKVLASQAADIIENAKD